MNPISRLSIRGYKSIRSLEDFKLGQLNVLIGANGAGKSNFIGFFRLLSRVMSGELNYFVGKSGGPDSFLHYGRKKTPRLSAAIFFANNGYAIELEPTQGNAMFFASERFYWNHVDKWFPLGSGHLESLAQSGVQKTLANYIVPAVKSWVVYHFHDTSENAPVKQIHALNDNERLRPDGANLAAYLFRLQEQFPSHYTRIEDTIRLVAPFFGKFQLRNDPLDPRSIQLEWHEKGGDYPFLAHHLSDGTLRFICLTTVLLQPDELMPTTILIDEPELGLHPYAIELLAALMKQASLKHQLIVSTQSVELLNQFDAADVIVVDRNNGQSTFTHLDPDALTAWLEDYTLGEMWMRNLFGGRPG